MAKSDDVIDPIMLNFSYSPLDFEEKKSSWHPRCDSIVPNQFLSSVSGYKFMLSPHANVTTCTSGVFEHPPVPEPNSFNEIDRMGNGSLKRKREQGDEEAVRCEDSGVEQNPAKDSDPKSCRPSLPQDPATGRIRKRTRGGIRHRRRKERQQSLQSGQQATEPGVALTSRCTSSNPGATKKLDEPNFGPHAVPRPDVSWKPAQQHSALKTPHRTMASQAPFGCGLPSADEADQSLLGSKPPDCGLSASSGRASQATEAIGKASGVPWFPLVGTESKPPASGLCAPSGRAPLAAGRAANETRERQATKAPASEVLASSGCVSLAAGGKGAKAYAGKVLGGDLGKSSSENGRNVCGSGSAEVPVTPAAFQSGALSAKSKKHQEEPSPHARLPARPTSLQKSDQVLHGKAGTTAFTRRPITLPPVGYDRSGED